VTCRSVAGQRLGKHSRFAVQRAINITIEEEVFSMYFAYIHCWATDVFSMGPP
jgi:hypothetical protein